MITVKMLSASQEQADGAKDAVIETVYHLDYTVDTDDNGFVYRSTVTLPETVLPYEVNHSLCSILTSLMARHAVFAVAITDSELGDLTNSILH